MQPTKLWVLGYRLVGALTLVVTLDPTGSLAEGQLLKPLRVGDWVRITRANAVPAVVRTRLVLLDQRSVMVQGGDVDTMMVFPSRSIVRFEVSRGKHPALTFGAPVLGGLLGAALGPIIITENPTCTSGVGIVEECVKEMSDEAVGALFGGMALGFVGSLVARERWREVPLQGLFFNVNARSARVGVSLVSR